MHRGTWGGKISDHCECVHGFWLVEQILKPGNVSETGLFLSERTKHRTDLGARMLSLNSLHKTRR